VNPEQTRYGAGRSGAGDTACRIGHRGLGWFRGRVVGTAGGFEFGFQGGDLGGLLLAGGVDDLVDRAGQVFVQFLGGAGDGRGGDEQVLRDVAVALLELGLPLAVGGAGDGQGELEGLGLLRRRLLGGGLLRLLRDRSGDGLVRCRGGDVRGRGRVGVRESGVRRRVRGGDGAAGRRVERLGGSVDGVGLGFSCKSVYGHRCGDLPG
jgi:hypothetical protein